MSFFGFFLINLAGRVILSAGRKKKERGRETDLRTHDNGAAFTFQFMNFEFEGPRYWPHALVILIALGIVYYAVNRRPAIGDVHAPLMGLEAQRAQQRDALTYA